MQAELLGIPEAVSEMQLAHTVPDANGTSYNRTQWLLARQEMMQQWADYLDKLATGADVIQFKNHDFAAFLTDLGGVTSAKASLSM